MAPAESYVCSQNAQVGVGQPIIDVPQANLRLGRNQLAHTIAIAIGFALWLGSRNQHEFH